MKNTIPLHWCVSNNVGDALNYWLIKKISDKEPYWVPMEVETLKYICIGSILNWANKNTVVWGAGLANQTDKVDPSAKLLCVRGPISWNIALENGVSDKFPPAYCDPALLVSKYYKGKKCCKSTKVGIIPHYADYHELKDYNHEFKIINVFDPIEKIVDDIKKCQVILSSSLHGLILADSYGIPNKQIKISDFVLGDGTKFYDYFLSVKRTWAHPMIMSRIVKYSQSDIVKMVKKEYESIDLKTMQKELLDTCPFI